MELRVVIQARKSGTLADTLDVNLQDMNKTLNAHICSKVKNTLGAINQNSVLRKSA